MDQTPAPFEYLSGRTYELKGSHTVWAKAEKSRWDKRQATIQLTVLADGTMLKPWILYRGKGNLSKAELDQYDKRVTVRFNEEAYANEEIILEWIEQQLIPIIHRKDPFTGPISIATGLPCGVAAPETPGLIALDSASFHKTPAVLNALKKLNITPSLIPAGCTSLIQVLDVAVNRPFKDFLKEAMEFELFQLVHLQGEEILAVLDRCDEENPELEETTLETAGFGVISAVGLRRILLTRAVGTAWERFQAEKYRNSIIKTFRSVGLALPIDGSCDNELSVKGLTPEELIVGDWENDLPGPKSTEEIEIAPENDENSGVFFVELDGVVLQVGRAKKTKRKRDEETHDHEVLAPVGEPGIIPVGTQAQARRQITCSTCHLQGHNKRSCKSAGTV